MTEEILNNAMESLEEIRRMIRIEIALSKAEIDRYKESNQELEEDYEIVEVYNSETQKLTDSLKAHKIVRQRVENYRDMYDNQKKFYEVMLKYNTNFGNLDDFFAGVLHIDGIDSQELYKICLDISKTTSVKLPFKTSDFDKFNKIRGLALMPADKIYTKKKYMGPMAITMAEKQQAAEIIKKNLKDPFFVEMYDKLIKYFKDNLKRIDEIAEENSEKIQEIRDKEIEKRKNEVNSHIKEFETRIEKDKVLLASIDGVYKLYDEYKKTPTKEILLKLSAELANLVVLDQREAKILTYQPTNKPKAEEVKETKEVKEEKPATEEPSSEEFDNDYFTKKKTERIICFLGPDDNWIYNDIDKFDRALKIKICDKLNDLFTTLKSTNNNPFNGHGPGPEVSDFTKLLLKTPINAIYRNYGTSGTPYRIHAIEKTSEFLRKLGFGKGRIVFFGSIGANNDEDKTDTYNRVGSRAIRKINSHGAAPELRSNFDYIEHIIRGYIPVSFLSKKDQDAVFKYKSNKVKVIENKKYIYYDVLTDESINNVRSWLIEYFANQTNKMDQIIKKGKELKGETLD